MIRQKKILVITWANLVEINKCISGSERRVQLMNMKRGRVESLGESKKCSGSMRDKDDQRIGEWGRVESQWGVESVWERERVGKKCSHVILKG